MQFLWHSSPHLPPVQYIALDTMMGVGLRNHRNPLRDELTQRVKDFINKSDKTISSPTSSTKTPSDNQDSQGSFRRSQSQSPSGMSPDTKVNCDSILSGDTNEDPKSFTTPDQPTSFVTPNRPVKMSIAARSNVSDPLLDFLEHKRRRIEGLTP